MKKFIEVALVLAILLLTASVSSAQFASVPEGFTQSIFGYSTASLGGVAFAPNGDVWSDSCAFHGGTLLRFPLQGHPATVTTGTPNLTGCGLTNHPDGKLYTNTDQGIVAISNPMSSDVTPTASAPIGAAGNALGITVDPQTKRLVYVGADCGLQAVNSLTCTIYSVDPAVSEPSSSIFGGANAQPLDRSVASYVDGITFDPSGNFLLLSTRAHWNGDGYVNFPALTILNRAGNVVQQFSSYSCGVENSCTIPEPDGIAFHAGSPLFVVTDNTDGTMSRFDFPNNNLTQTPTFSQFASGGLRGDLSQVGPDGCLYITQGQGQPTKDIAQICGGFAQPTGSSQSVTLHFTTTNTTRIASSNPDNPHDPAAQSLALTFTSVIHPFDVTVTFFYEPTDISTGTTGIGIADGVCEKDATATTDFDCRLTTFTYQGLPTTDQIVPHIFASHNNMGVWERAETTAMPGTDYTGPVFWYHAWNTNPALVNSKYPTGWNILNPQMYDRPGTIGIVPNPSIDFIKNITTFSKNCDPDCVGNPDPGVGGKTPTLNDIVGAAPPNPPGGAAAFGTVELLVPVPGISPFPYFKGLPMLVAFELEKPGTETSISNALTPPNTVSVATFQTTPTGGIGNNIPVQMPRGFPSTFTYNPFLKTYYIFLSPAPYTADGRTKYILQINSALFPAPVNATFVVKNQF
jgi:hypothetical protein